MIDSTASAIRLSVLAPPQGTTAHLGTLVRAVDEPGPEAFFKAFASDPELAVEALTEDDTWAEKQKAIVDALASAPDKKTRDAVKLLIPAIVPARFLGMRRVGAECLGRQVIMHDFDGVSFESFDDACEHIRAQLPDRFLAIHTTATERDEKGWRLRAVEILDREATPEEWEQRVKPHMRSLGEHDKQALDIVRLLFMPVRTAGYQFKVYEGPRTKLDELERPDMASVEPPPPKPLSGPASLSVRRLAAAKTIAAGWPESNRHGAQRALAGALCYDRWPEAEALEFLCTVCREAGNEERPKREKTIRDTYRKAAAGGHIQGWTALEAHVDSILLTQARVLLDPNADLRREFETQILSKPKVEESSPSPSLPEDAHFSSRIKRGKDWSEPYVRPPYLLDGIIPFETVTTFFAEGGSVKSWSAFALGISVATGTPWLGQYPVSQGKVLILDYEDGWAEFRRRKEILLRQTPHLDLFSLEYLYCGPNIADLDLWKWLEGQGYSLIVIDALSSGMPLDSDENDQRFADGLKAAGRFVSATKCNVLAVHHANKSGGIRGASAIRDQSDVVFQFVSVSETDDNKRMRMECNKPGPQKKPAPVNVELTDQGLQTFKDEAHEVGRNAFTKVDIKAAIRLALEGAKEPITSVSALRKATGRGQNETSTAFKEMVAAGEVVSLGTRGYACDRDEHRARRVLSELDSGLLYATASELARQAYVDTRFVDRMRLAGIICTSGEGRWMRIEGKSIEDFLRFLNRTENRTDRSVQ